MAKTWIYHKNHEAKIVDTEEVDMEALEAEGWGDEPYNPENEKRKKEAAEAKEKQRLADREALKDELREEILAENKANNKPKK